MEERGSPFECSSVALYALRRWSRWCFRSRCGSPARRRCCTSRIWSQVIRHDAWRWSLGYLWVEVCILLRICVTSGLDTFFKLCSPFGVFFTTLSSCCDSFWKLFFSSCQRLFQLIGTNFRQFYLARWFGIFEQTNLLCSSSRVCWKFFIFNFFFNFRSGMWMYSTRPSRICLLACWKIIGDPAYASFHCIFECLRLTVAVWTIWCTQSVAMLDLKINHANLSSLASEPFAIEPRRPELVGHWLDERPLSCFFEASCADAHRW